MSETGPEGHPDRHEWDERYADAPVWSGRPNGALVAEVEHLAPGRALDVGCGEGADAVWLAEGGWRVTAVDVSAVAVERGLAAASSAGLEIDWRVAGLLDLDPLASHDLVSAQYPALRRTPDRAAERALLDAVAPGGTLLVVTHADIDRAAVREHGFDPDEYVGHDQVRAALEAVAERDEESWVVEVDERRERHVEGGGGAHHTHDLVLRARRT